ncbi:MAG: recombinase family protein [Acidimicrobiales bacterium]
MDAGAPLSNTKRNTRVAIYARVSTEDQSCQIQVEQLSAVAKAQGWEAQLFRDDGVSGILDNRPELDKLRGAMRRGEFDVILVTKIDRLGRSIQMIRRFWDEAEALGVRIRAHDQGIDTSTAAGRFQRDMLAALAEFERELILERTQAGIQRARNLNKKFGRPRTIPDDVRATVVDRARSGQRVKEIARDLKIKESTVRTLIRRGIGSVQSPPRESAGLGSTVDASGFKVSSLNGGPHGAGP